MKIKDVQLNMQVAVCSNENATVYVVKEISGHDVTIQEPTPEKPSWVVDVSLLQLATSHQLRNYFKGN